ncbi:MAG: hypothetical protein IPJ27_08890 [Candidatus Accumulibacter sp.]|uniref:Calcium-binding protein n=1 Tax=Candidatus Accumulibacter proximus TaxID=2954385 RepID=A0A935UGW5_9PROT|nr:hypothetical protein [Candidatus Accumulibacter proximus]
MVAAATTAWSAGLAMTFIRHRRRRRRRRSDPGRRRSRRHRSRQLHPHRRSRAAQLHRCRCLHRHRTRLNNRLTGGAGNDSLSGLAGNDTLIGGAGNDSLVGGLGDDLYLVTDAGDAVVEAAAGGVDRVDTDLASYTLTAEVEQLSYIGVGAFTGTGQGLNNTLTGGAGNDSLSGLAGNDTLIGNAGNDTLDGGQGTDSLVGGAGDDVYRLDVLGDTVSEAASAGTDRVELALSAGGHPDGQRRARDDCQRHAQRPSRR